MLIRKKLGKNPVTMVPIAMRRPTKEHVYNLSKLTKPIQISQEDFVKRFADKPTAVNVSFDDDGVSNSKRITAYFCEKLMKWFIPL